MLMVKAIAQLLFSCSGNQQMHMSPLLPDQMPQSLRKFLVLQKSNWNS